MQKPPEPKAAARVVQDARKRYRFTCSVCRLDLPAADKPSALALKAEHVASAPHRSALRAARRE